MDYAFEEGKAYRNRNGRYKVLVIKESKMLVRSDDGREQVLDIALQARIWAALQLEEERETATAVQHGNKRKSKIGYPCSRR